MMKKRLARRERRRLNRELEEALAATSASVRAAAAETGKTIPLDPTKPENVEHWLKYSYGSWSRPKKGREDA